MRQTGTDAIYQGFRMTITYDEVIVYEKQGAVTARFAGMAAARSFIRTLRRQERRRR